MSWQTRLAIKAENAQSPIDTVYCKSVPDSPATNGVVTTVGNMSHIKNWIGPYYVTDEAWEQLSDEERSACTHQQIQTRSGATVDLYKFPVPHTVWRGYHDIALGGVLWPIFHSEDPGIEENPQHILDNSYTPPEQINLTVENLNHKWACYKQFFDLGNRAISRLTNEGNIPSDERVWVQDFHSGGIKGDAFSFHIPFPPLDYLKKTFVNGQPVLKMAFFRELVSQYVEQHEVITFHRDSDRASFIAVLKELGTVVARNHDGIQSLKIRLGDKHFTTHAMTLPLGIDHPKIATEAQANAALSQSKYMPELLAHTGIHRAPDTQGQEADAAEVGLPALLQPALQQGHRLFLSGHRNSSMKCSLEKLMAIEEFLEKHPEEVGKTHFTLFLTGKRAPGSGYPKLVCEKAKELRERFGESVIVALGGIDHGDFMGLMRHENTIGYISSSRIEGHDLTAREAIAANSDKENAAIAVITTSGAGVSDFVGGTEGNPGAFIIPGGQAHNATSVKTFVTGMCNAFESVIQLRGSQEGIGTLQQRFKVMKEAAQQLSIRNMHDRTADALAKAGQRTRDRS